MNAPSTPSRIAESLVLTRSTVSKDLDVMLEFGLVEFTPLCVRRGNRGGTCRLYRPGNGVRVFPSDGMLQFNIQTPAGHWFHVHLDEGGGREPVVTPPNKFVRGS